jgi:hypothetical protein
VFAPTILHIYGINKPGQMQGRVMTEIFQDGPQSRPASKVASAK